MDLRNISLLLTAYCLPFTIIQFTVYRLQFTVLMFTVYCLRFTVQGLGVEIDNSKCQEDGKDAEANEKVALDGALATLVGYTTLVTADVMFLVVFLIGHC